MIVNFEKHPEQKEIKVLVTYTDMNGQVKKLQELISSVDKTIRCKGEDNDIWINASDIYYIESVDKHTFIYCKKEVYAAEQRLYQLAEELLKEGFVRVSKSCIININMLQSIRTIMNSRMEATLINGERITVTRKFISEIRRKLEER